MNWIKTVFESERQLAIPVMTHPGIEAIGHTVKEAVCNGEVHFKAMKYLSENTPADACTAIMDLTLEAEAFGADISMPENEIPTITGRLVTDFDSVNALNVPGLDVARLPEYLKANKLAVQNIKDKPILSGCIGPYSLAGRLYGMSEIMLGLYLEPETIHMLLQKCTDFILSYCRELKKIGTQGVIMAEPAAGLLANNECHAFSTRYVKQIVDELQDDDFVVVLHNCGNSGQCTQAMIDSGANALHFGNAIQMEQVMQQCPSDVVVMGNLDPVGVFRQGNPGTVALATEKLLSIAGSYKNFVISSGCDLPPHVPAVNLKSFFEAVHNFESAENHVKTVF